VCFVVSDVIVKPIIDLVNLAVNPFQQLMVVVMITVVLTPYPLQQDSEHTAGCEHRKQDRQRVCAHDATACTSTST
jgi:hypothetical protein